MQQTRMSTKATIHNALVVPVEGSEKVYMKFIIIVRRMLISVFEALVKVQISNFEIKSCVIIAETNKNLYFQEMDNE